MVSNMWRERGVRAANRSGLSFGGDEGVWELDTQHLEGAEDISNPTFYVMLASLGQKRTISNMFVLCDS